MATLKNYTCKKCGYTVQSDAQGHYSLMTGEVYDFKCSHCKEIVSLTAQDLAEQNYELTCPHCSSTGTLSSWNPVEGRCPKCGAPMEESSDITFLAD